MHRRLDTAGLRRRSLDVPGLPVRGRGSGLSAGTVVQLVRGVVGVRCQRLRDWISLLEWGRPLRDAALSGRERLLHDARALRRRTLFVHRPDELLAGMRLRLRRHGALSMGPVLGRAHLRERLLGHAQRHLAVPLLGGRRTDIVVLLEQPGQRWWAGGLRQRVLPVPLAVRVSRKHLRGQTPARDRRALPQRRSGGGGFRDPTARSAAEPPRRVAP